MINEMRKTGVDVLGDIPWGTHFCLFYETQADLLEISVSYCKAGLESQEFCLWVVAELFAVEDARRALKRAVPDFERYVADHSIEIVAAHDWYLQDGTFDLNRVIRGWNERLARASARGYAGVRVTGDTAWLEKKDWKDFCEYEDSVNQAIANQRLAALCTYPLAACGATEILDVVRTHQFAVTKRRGTWDVIETAGYKQAKAEIKRLNEELEQRVVERTTQLTAANEELHREIAERQRAEDGLRRSEDRLRLVLDTTPALILSARPDGYLDYFNQRWLEYVGLSLEKLQGWGWTSVIHPDDVEGIVGKWRTALARGEPFEAEARVRRADGEYRWLLHRKVPLRDEHGNIVKWHGSSIDIDDRKRAEEERRRGETYLAMAQRMARMGVWSWKPSCGDMFGSEEFYRIFGIEPDKAKLTREVFQQRIHPEDRPRYESEINAAVAERRNWELDYRIVLPDASVKYVHAIGKPILDKSGDILEFVGTTLDITERKRAEQELRQAEEHIRAILEYSPNWIYLKDTEGRYLLVNREIERVFGISQEQIKGKTDSEIFPPEQATEYRANDLKVLRAGLTMEFEEIALLEDGQHTSIVHKFPLFDSHGNIYATGGVATDITERKRVEEALRRSEERYRLIVENQTEFIVKWLPDGTRTFANENYYRTFGIAEADCLGTSFYPLVDPEYREEIERKVAALTPDKPEFTEEHPSFLPDGQHWQQWTTRGIFNAGGTLIELLSAGRDITQLKRAEEELRQLSGRLLRLQDEERRRIARDLHDSTGQNLVALATMLGQLRGSIPSAERKLRRLLSQCKTLADQCIREVRTLSYVLHPPLLDQSGLGDAIHDYVNGFTRRSGIHVELELSSRLGRMARDVELALFRVVQESLTNIQHHSGSRRAKIRVHRNSDLTLEIGDSGHGLSPKVERGNGEPGLEVGVGIPSMQERVKLIGGRLEIDSTSHGTIVRVTIPLERNEREKAAHSGG